MISVSKRRWRDHCWLCLSINLLTTFSKVLSPQCLTTRQMHSFMVLVVLELHDNAFQLDHVTRAILALKNDNLQELEHVLNTDGISVDMQDQHGNTLFILACQQGNKMLAMVLLWRGADKCMEQWRKYIVALPVQVQTHISCQILDQKGHRWWSKEWC